MRQALFCVCQRRHTPGGDGFHQQQTWTLMAALSSEASSVGPVSATLIHASSLSVADRVRVAAVALDRSQPRLRPRPLPLPPSRVPASAPVPCPCPEACSIAKHYSMTHAQCAMRHEAVRVSMLDEVRHPHCRGYDVTT